MGKASDEGSLASATASKARESPARSEQRLITKALMVRINEVRRRRELTNEQLVGRPQTLHPKPEPRSRFSAGNLERKPGRTILDAPLAQRWGLTMSMLYRMASGGPTPSLVTLLRLRVGFGVTPDELMGDLPRPLQRCRRQSYIGETLP